MPCPSAAVDGGILIPVCCLETANVRTGLRTLLCLSGGAVNAFSLYTEMFSMLTFIRLFNAQRRIAPEQSRQASTLVLAIIQSRHLHSSILYPRPLGRRIYPQPSFQPPHHSSHFYLLYPQPRTTRQAPVRFLLKEFLSAMEPSL